MCGGVGAGSGGGGGIFVVVVVVVGGGGAGGSAGGAGVEDSNRLDPTPLDSNRLGSTRPDSTRTDSTLLQLGVACLVFLLKGKRNNFSKKLISLILNLRGWGRTQQNYSAVISPKSRIILLLILLCLFPTFQQSVIFFIQNWFFSP